MKTIFQKILASTALCLTALACNSHIEAAPQLKGNTYYQRTGVSMGDLRRLPLVDGDPEAIKKAYDTIIKKYGSLDDYLKEWQIKIQNSKEKNKTFNTSKPENIYYS